MSVKEEIDFSAAHEGAVQHHAIGKDIGAIISGLVRAVRALQVYGEGHVTYRQSFMHLFRNLSAFLREYYEVSFQIEQYAILYGNRVLYQEQQKEVSISFRLFRDGIRDINFYEGLSPDELLLFLAIVSQPLNEDDIAIALWESDFAHISFYVVDEDDASYSYDIQEVSPADIDFDQKMSALLKRENINLDTPLTAQLTPDEFENLKMYIADIEMDSSLPLLVAILVNFIGTNVSHEAIEGLKSILKICLNNRDFFQARQIVTKLQDSHAANVLEILEDEEMIVGFKEVVSTARDSKFEEFLQFIKLLSKRSIPYLFKMMAGVKRRDRLAKLHRLILDIAQDDPSSIATALSNEDYSVVTNAVTVLAMMRTKEAALYLQPLVYHKKPKVRASALTGLESIGAPSMIAAFLDDSLSDLRIKALNILSNLKYKKIYSKLLQTMKSNDFLIIEPNERKAYFNCLVANGGDSVVSDLKEFLYKKLFFGTVRYRSIRNLAAASLADIGSEEALEILNRGAQNKHKDIRTACKMSSRIKKQHEND